MRRQGRPRRAALVQLCPAFTPDQVVVDVGADHGHVAAALGAIATERAPQRRGRSDVRWVIADGLRPFRRVDVAIIAGMGARTIASILQAGPRPAVAVLHAQDDPVTLRRWLAENGWRIDAEALAEEARRFAEVIRVRPGREDATGSWLDFGPRLLTDGHPLLARHLRQLHGYFTELARETFGRAEDVHREAALRADFLASRLAELDDASPS